MGIDAAILIRKVPKRVVTDEWLRETSWLMCQSLGADRFWFHDDQPPLHKSKFYAEDAEHYGLKGKKLEDGDVYTQDGPPIVAEEGECLLEVSMWSRWYGIGYERGDLIFLCSIAEWFEANLPECEVWYGGDSSGVEAEPFTEVMRKKLKNHLYSGKGRDYFNNFDKPSAINPEGDRHEFGKPKPCAICPGGTYHGFRNGWGTSYALYSCPGCGKSAKTTDSGQTWVQEK